MILADTSVWSSHFRRGEPGLAFALLRPSIVMHEMVYGELLLGHIKRGSEVESLLFDLRRIPALEPDAVLAFIHARKLRGTGIGWVDASLLAAAHAAGARLWSLDKPLMRQAQRLGIASSPCR